MTAPFLGSVDFDRGAAAPCGATRRNGHWIVGDVRLDRRRDLLEALGRPDDNDCGNLALVADAYVAWGDACLDRIAGDFSFAIWDERRRRLFAARDPLGIRPLYYATTPQRIVLGNTLNGVRCHSGVAAALDDQAVGDFLLFDAPTDPTRTMFAGVRRLAPAHALVATRETPVCTRRYWSLPIDEPLRLRCADDYLDGFRERVRHAVAERLASEGVGVFMSGGVDSTTLAATAVALGADVEAFAWVEDAADGGRERRGAVAAAAHLGIDLDVHEPDAGPVDWDWEQKPLHQIEPTADAWHVDHVRAYHRRIAARRRVFFYGEGPDNALYYEWRPYLSHLIRTAQIRALAGDAWHYVSGLSRIPLLGAVRALWRRPGRPTPTYPRWLQRDFQRRAGLEDRWRGARGAAVPRHPTRPDAYASLHNPLWQVLFDAYDPERSGTPMDVRHPFLDLRVLRFLLSVPVIPWCRDKFLVRRAMRGALPDVVLNRRKAGHRPDGRERIERRLAAQPTPWTDALGAYVDAAALAADPLSTPAAVVRMLRVKALNRWLADLEPEVS